jgi:flagellar assembly protein FliH
MSTRVIKGEAALQGDHMDWKRAAPEPPPGPAQPPRDLLAETDDDDEVQALEERLAAAERAAAEREQQAHRAGLEQGRAAGEREAAARLDAVIERFAATVHELAERRKQLRHEAERDVVKLSIAIGRRVLHRELNADPEALLGLVKAALEKLDTREVDRVRVHPADAAAVKAQLERLRPSAHFEIVADSALERGAALFDGARGSLDASVETQLAEIERGLTDRLRG